MFTGIIEEIGIVKQFKRKENLSVLDVRAHKVLRGTKPGDSVAVDGVCLTVTAQNKNMLTFDIVRETLDKTTLRYLAAEDKVNLERALKVNHRIHGHFVTGHVDQIGIIKKKDYKIKLYRNFGKPKEGFKSIYCNKRLHCS